MKLISKVPCQNFVASYEIETKVNRRVFLQVSVFLSKFTNDMMLKNSPNDQTFRLKRSAIESDNEWWKFARVCKTER